LLQAKALNPSPQSRDISLDFLKGIGCVLMILAHAKELAPDVKWMAYLGGFAPVFFFSIAGITGAFQAHRYAPRQMLILYSLLLLLGFGYNGITHPHFLADIDFDILQMIAFGTLAVYFFERYLAPAPWVYLFLAVVSFLVKVFFLDWLKIEPVFGIAGILLPPGLFPVFPWLFLFFAGIFAYRVENRTNFWMLVFIFVLCAALIPIYPLDFQNKWNMSVGYFLACNLLLFFMFYGVRRFPFFQNGNGKGWLIYLGRNSMLFLFVHVGWIELFRTLRSQYLMAPLWDYPLVVHGMLLLLTIASIWILMGIIRQFFFPQFTDSIYLWFSLAAVIFVAAWLVRNDFILTVLDLAIGILMGLYFPALAASFKKLDSSTLSL
jgi:hypothetical protein